MKYLWGERMHSKRYLCNKESMAQGIFELIKKQNIPESKFDLIFCDPPFKDANIEKLIQLICNNNVLQKDGIFILHRNINTKEKSKYALLFNSDSDKDIDPMKEKKILFVQNNSPPNSLFARNGHILPATGNSSLLGTFGFLSVPPKMRKVLVR